MLKAKTYQISGPWRGQLAIIPRPRGGDWLEDDVRTWRTSGIDVVVSLLTPSEVEELELNLEQHWCELNHMAFRSFPIFDRSVPDSLKAATALINDLDQALGSGKNVAVHCRQGIGRSGMITAALLIATGVEPSAAWESIRIARGREVPDTGEQREWVRALSRATTAL